MEDAHGLAEHVEVSKHDDSNTSLRGLDRLSDASYCTVNTALLYRRRPLPAIVLGTNIEIYFKANRSPPVTSNW